jgi:AraC-like DNA-binding protein
MVRKVPLYTIDGEEGLDGMFRLYSLKGEKIKKSTLPKVGFPTDRPHRHDFFEIFVFVEGEGNHSIDFEKYPIGSKSIHLVSPYRTHLIEKGKVYSGYLLAFNREFHSFYHRSLPPILNISYFRNNNISPTLALDDEVFSTLLNIIEQMTVDFRKADWAVPELTRSYLNIFLLIINELFNEKLNHKTKRKKNELLPKFINLVEEKYADLHKVKEYADLLHITPVKLNRICSQFVDKNASDLIMDRIVLEAKRLLVFSNRSNKEIAYSLGYSDPSYFSRFFRKKTGKSPSEFRNIINNKYQQMK